ncbi:MAG TPA: hypothetical protein VEK57_29315 [Thermoanaerobaculia bacterium]|nr:hypothetical protein [Thermoanaerobaculia bacterium]
MAQELTKAAASDTPDGNTQNVVVVEGNGVSGTVQAPTDSGNIWFAFEIGAGGFTLDVNFNGQNFPNIPEGQYQLSGLTTPLNLTVQGSGSTKLAWVAN